MPVPAVTEHITPDDLEFGFGLRMPAAFVGAGRFHKVAIGNEKHQCSLTTTIRSLPEPNNNRSNDTMLHVLNLKLEENCTRGASDSCSQLVCSQLGVVESAAHHPMITTQQNVLYWRLMLCLAWI